MSLLSTSSRLLCLFLLFSSCLMSKVFAMNDKYIGEWNLVINQVSGGKRIQNGALVIDYQDGRYVAHVQGGPITIKIMNENIEMAIDDWTGASMPFERYYRGVLVNGIMTGKFGPEKPITDKQQDLCNKIPLGCPHPTGTWKAERIEKSIKSKESAKLVNLQGKWALNGRGMRRWTVDMTEAAIEWNKNFDVEMDLPRQRCVSSGLVNNFGSAPEIFQDENKITMIFSSEVRRIYLDDRQPPEFSDWYPLGFSSGYWDGSTLVVETTNLMPSVRGFMGNPISSEAKIVEKYELDKEGLLHAHMTLYDPRNYLTPPIATATWKKVPDETVVFPLLCDPDSFYRQLYDEDKFDDYIERSNRRY